MSKEEEVVIINPQLIKDLIDGKREPATNEESIALAAYEEGFGGEMLMYVLNDFPMSYDDMTDVERGYFLIGYCIGQVAHNELDTDKLVKGNQTVH